MVGVEAVERRGIPMPLIARDRVVAVDIDAAELVADRAAAADCLRARQDVVVVGVERFEHGGAAVPLIARQAAVAIGVEVVEPLLAIVIGVAIRAAEEFRSTNRAVAVAIEAPEHFGIAVPFFPAQAAVVIVVEAGEPGLGPVVVARD